MHNKSHIPVNSLAQHLARYKEEILSASTRVIDSNWLVLGPELQNFERSFADYLGTDHCIGVANGTDAIELALRAFGVGPGDRVATVANAGMYTTTALMAIGANPVFMDVDLKSRNVSVDAVQMTLKSGVKAVVVTHLYGLITPDIEAIAKLCDQHNVPLLEDCAQAHGAAIGSRRAGSFGRAASFSFYPTKNLGALGDGGAIVTNHADIAEKVMLLRQYGWTTKYRVGMHGARNSRLDELQAAILSVFLPNLDESNRFRREIASQYSKTIKHPDVITPPVYGNEYVAHLYVIRCKNRDALRAHLQSHGIATDVHYPVPDHKQEIFGNQFAAESLPNTELLCDEILTLPCFPEMTPAQVEHVVTAINTWTR